MNGHDTGTPGAGGLDSVDVYELVCPHCGHVIRPRNLDSLQVKRYFRCSMCLRYFQNPYHVPPPPVKKQGLEVQCPSCGHRWVYTGMERPSIQCPICYRRFRHPKFPQNQPKGVKMRCRKCGHEWEYTGEKGDQPGLIRCPRCTASRPVVLEGEGIEVAEKGDGMPKP